MKLGDLVKLKKCCKDSERWALVLSKPDLLNCVKIFFLDSGTRKSALISNIEVISECRR